MSEAKCQCPVWVRVCPCVSAYPCGLESLLNWIAHRHSRCPLKCEIKICIFRLLRRNKSNRLVRQVVYLYIRFMSKTQFHNWHLGFKPHHSNHSFGEMKEIMACFSKAWHCISFTAGANYYCHKADLHSNGSALSKHFQWFDTEVVGDPNWWPWKVLFCVFGIHCCMCFGHRSSTSLHGPRPCHHLGLILARAISWMSISPITLSLSFRSLTVSIKINEPEKCPQKITTSNNLSN